MNYETAQSITHMIEIGGRFESALWLGSIFIWAVGYYILFQMYRLRFLKILIVSELLWAVQWLWSHQVFYPMPSSDVDATLTRFAILSTLDFIIGFMPLAVATIGAIMAVRHLQRKWMEMKDSRQDG